MQPLPAQDLRTNLGTWAIPACKVPAVASFMHDYAPNERYDPHFHGQQLETTYFDTAKYELRKNRRYHDKYITLRVRSYNSEVFALSAKTENSKFRVEIPEEKAKSLLSGKDALPILALLLPADLLARLLDIGHEQPIIPVVCIYCHRFAIEDDQDRFTLDTDIRTNIGRKMRFTVLEFKSTQKKETPQPLQNLNLTPVKMSKFLWASKN